MYVLRACVEKTELRPKRRVSRTNKRNHSAAFTRDASVEPLMARACVLFRRFVDTLRSDRVRKEYDCDLLAFTPLRFSTLFTS